MDCELFERLVCATCIAALLTTLALQVGCSRADEASTDKPAASSAVSGTEDSEFATGLDLRSGGAATPNLPAEANAAQAESLLDANSATPSIQALAQLGDTVVTGSVGRLGAGATQSQGQRPVSVHHYYKGSGPYSILIEGEGPSSVLQPGEAVLLVLTSRGCETGRLQLAGGEQGAFVLGGDTETRRQVASRRVDGEFQRFYADEVLEVLGCQP